jgi:hypothetical protein
MGLKMIRKLWVALIATFLMGIFSLSVSTTSANTSQLDQENTSGAGSLLISTGSRMFQIFKPSLNRLDKVTIEIIDPAGTLSCTIRKPGAEGWEEIAGVSDQAAVDGWNVFDFSDIAVTPETDYAISITGSYGPKWKYGISNVYTRGYAVWQSSDYATWDYNFQTYGYNVSTPSGDETPSADEIDTGTNTSTTSGESLGTATSSIAKPSSLTAKFLEEGEKRGVQLTWKASATSAIDGYKIFRSEKSNSGFIKVGQTDVKILDYLDSNITASKTYYYQVRAYKGSEQSYSSNTASATTPEDIGPAEPTNLKVSESGKDFLSVTWDKNTETNLAGYTITIYIGDKQIDTADLDKEATSHKFSGLEKDTNYKIKLVAKNSDNKLSPAAWAFGNTSALTSSLYAITPLVGALAGVGLALLIVLIVMMIKRRKAAKIKV